MHLIDEILPASMWIGGHLGAAAVGTAAIARLTPDRIPRVAVVTSAFVVVSYVHIPVPIAGTSVHLVLNGLVGILLGIEALPAIAVALFLHALGGHGGLQPLGVTALAMGSGALIARWVFTSLAAGRSHAHVTAAGFLAGFLALYWSAAVLFLALWIARESVRDAARIWLVAHAGLAVLEGCVTAAAVSFLYRVRPAIFDNGVDGAQPPSPGFVTGT